jgi:hypothetical protein
VTPGSPGFGSVRISPSLGDLDWVHGAVPTPAGLVRVSVDRDHLEVETPLPAEVSLSSDERTTRVPPGKHRIVRAR